MKDEDPANIEPPINSLTAGTVDEGGTMSLASRLMTEDADTPISELIYTVTEMPGDGSLELDGVALEVNGTFTQKDVTDGRVTYRHNGNPDGGDSFDWELSDGSNMISTTTFAITVTPTNDAPAIVNNPTTMVMEGGMEVLTPERFSAMDEEGGTITFQFVSAERGVLQLRVGAGTFNTMTPGQMFTVQDIADGNLRYVDPGTDDAMLAQQMPTTASFSWRMQDAEGGISPSATGAHVSTFTIESVDDPLVFTWRGAVCAPAGNNVLTNPILSFADPDNTAADYSVCLVSVGTGSAVLDSVTTVTQIPLVVQNGATNMAVGNCLAANALTSINVDSTAGGGSPMPLSANRGTVVWRLLKGATQVGANGSMTLPVKPATPCP